MPLPPRHPTLAIVGATGAVGREFLAILEERNFPHGPMRLLASARSAGTTLPYRGESHTVQALTDKSFEGIDLALFSAGGTISKQFCPIAAAAGAVVIDNSSAFRMDPAVPLVVPEVNPEALSVISIRPTRKSADPSDPSCLRASVPPCLPPRIIANPNCSTIIMLMAATPLRRAFGIDRIIASTYQAVSGAGAAAMEELRQQTADALVAANVLDPAATKVQPRIFHEPCAFNVFSHNTAVDPATGQNVEEQKMVAETRKIWGDPAARVTATCIRVPTFRAHAESLNITLSRPAAEEDVRAALAAAPGVEIVDDRAGNRFPTPLKAAGRDPVLVGRIRPDQTSEQKTEGGRRLWRGYDIFVCADQLRKGAALNAVQIAELMFSVR